jgi:hypothetical protein
LNYDCFFYENLYLHLYYLPLFDFSDYSWIFFIIYTFNI